MPPKRSDLHHITFHSYRSAILLSLPSSTTLSALKAALVPALKPLSSILPITLPKSTDGFRLYEEKSAVQGARATGGLRCIEDDDKGVMGRSIAALGWGRWKKVYVSFRDEDGRFPDPIYTIPDLEDEEVKDEEAPPPNYQPLKGETVKGEKE